MSHIATFLIAAMGWFAPAQAVQSPAPPVCEEGIRAAKAMPLPVPPPVFVRRAASSRLMVFIHGLQGDGTNSWLSRSGAYWPSLVAEDKQFFGDFDVFVYQYVVQTKAPVLLGAAADEFFNVAFKSELISKYRDAVFVTEGDGVFLVRELLRRVPPLAKRISMIYVAGRLEEASNPLDFNRIALREENRLIRWTEFRISDAQSWGLVDPQPWIHCAVLGDSRQRLAARDEGSSFCSTMPIALPGADWQALRPSCFGEPAHADLRRAVGQRTVPKTQAVAPELIKTEISSKAVEVPCGKQVLDDFLEFQIDVDSATEELLSVNATVADGQGLKAQSAVVDRVLGKVVIVKYTLIGPDPAIPIPGVQSACPTGRASIRLQLVKRRKN